LDKSRALILRALLLGGQTALGGIGNEGQKPNFKVAGLNIAQGHALLKAARWPVTSAGSPVCKYSRTVYMGCFIIKGINRQPLPLWECWHCCYLLPALEVKRAAVSRMIKSSPDNRNDQILGYWKSRLLWELFTHRLYPVCPN